MAPSNRYPTVTLSEIDQADVNMALLPDEPYNFTSRDKPEASTAAPTRLVSERPIT